MSRVATLRAMPLALPRRALLLAVTAISSAWIAVYAVMTLLAKPIADDYKYFSFARDHGLFGGIYHQLMVENGRYTSSAIVSAGWLSLGEAAVPVLCLTFLVMLWAALVVAAKGLLPLQEQGQWLAAAAMGTTALAALLGTTPSTFDSFLWLTSAVNYIPSMALCFLIALGVKRVLVSTKKRTRAATSALTALISALVFFTMGLSEIPAALAVASFAGLVVIELIWKPWRRLPALLSLLVSAAAGLATLYFAPSSVIKRERTMGDPLGTGLAALPDAVSDFTRSSGIFSLIWFAVLAAVLVAATRAPASRRTSWLSLVGGLGAALVVTPFVIFEIGAAQDHVPWRTYVYPVAIFGWGLAVAALAATWLLRGVRLQALTRTGLLTGAAVGMVALAVVQISSATDMLRALSLRGQLAAVRDHEVSIAVSSGAAVVQLRSAPMLAGTGSATDFSFDPDRHSFMLNGYRMYMSIPEDAEIEYLTDQPVGYCLESQGPSFAQARTCSQLAEATDR